MYCASMLVCAGGVTNALGMLLAKMGIRQLEIYDDDLLEIRNCPVEPAYSYNMVGKPKVSAMADSIYHVMENGVNVNQHYERVDVDTELALPGIVICGVDSMKSRKIIWENIKNNFFNVPLFIDGRSAGEYMQIFAFSPADYQAVEDYETWLFDDEEAMPLECGARNIGYISYYMAAEIAYIITLFYRGQPIEFMRSKEF